MRLRDYQEAAAIGMMFNAWLQQFTARGYTYEWRILNCADYGDATSRRRFFLQAVKHGCGKIRWPEPTHAENPQPDLFGHELKRWRGVNECLDYSDIGNSIFGRKNPLAHNTLRRVAVGLRKYCGIDLQIDVPGAGESRTLPPANPSRPPHTNNRTTTARPFLVKLNNHATVEDVADPLTTVTTSGNHHAICTPFFVTEQANNAPRSVKEPLRTQTTVRKDYLCRPFIVEITNNGKARKTGRPIGTQTSKDHFALVRSFVLGQQSGAQLRADGEPCPAVATAGSIRKVDAAILDMSRPGGRDSGHVRPASKPIQTLTTCDNVQGVFPVLEDGRIIDIRIRMLKPSELAAAHSFPKDYKLPGTRADQVKQIGNSIPVETAKAIVKAIFGR